MQLFCTTGYHYKFRKSRMHDITELFSLKISDVKTDPITIKKAMGYRGGKAPQPFDDLLRSLIQEAQNYINLQAGYRILPRGSAHAETGWVRLNETVFKTDKLISSRLKKMDAAAIFTTSVGHEFDTWSRRFFEDGDPVSGYMVDLIGSEYAEAAADWIELRIIEKAKQHTLNCSNRYSPGYCGWSVAEQHKLFGFLPENFCGISLTETALMLPIKSVSGIIGIGPEMIKKDYQCKICTLDNCYKRNTKPGNKQTNAA
ncbi:MAG: hypothetical protein DWQ05_06870 [Calditrichaeota bacterium]|nr:MAG: hypothetical protein DWQ05_06870 [Calditrichota bacterium]